MESHGDHFKKHGTPVRIPHENESLERELEDLMDVLSKSSWDK